MSWLYFYKEGDKLEAGTLLIFRTLFTVLLEIPERVSERSGIYYFH